MFVSRDFLACIPGPCGEGGFNHIVRFNFVCKRSSIVSKVLIYPSETTGPRGEGGFNHPVCFTYVGK